MAVPRLTAEGARPPGLVVAEPRWDAYYAVVFAACLAIVEAGPLHTTGRLIATGALIAMVPWYVLVGLPLCGWTARRRPGAGRSIWPGWS